MGLKMSKMMNKKEYIRNALIALGFSVLFLLTNSIVENQGTIVISEIFGAIKELKSICLLILFLALGIVSARVGFDNIFKYRYWIALGAFVIFVIFGVTGSSIGMFTEYFGVEDRDILFGITRSIRSDEFAVFTPMTWSQYYDPNGHFSYFSSVLRATDTDVFLEYGQPVASWLIIYRPFFLGFLFLPIANGMAFFWYGRLIALFMVSFEFGRRITSDNKPLSVVYAIIITFSPVVQWWFAINGFVEMLIYLQLAILLLDKFLCAETWGIKIGCAAGITISAGGFALTMYPAWMIPFAYVILGLIIWLIIENRKNIKLQKGDIIIIACSLLILSLSMIYIYHMSKETIHIMMNTVYPGKRVSDDGQRSIVDYLVYTSNFWFPLKNESMSGNVCEKSCFITLFPLPYIFYIIYIIKTEKRDLFCNVIVAISLFFLIYCNIGFPEWLSKITLLSYVPDKRCIIILQFCEVLLIIRGISILGMNDVKIKKSIGWIGAISLSVISVILLVNLYRNYYSIKMIIVQVFVFIYIYIGTFYYDKKGFFEVWELIFSMFILVTGILVNPFRVGVGSVDTIPQLEMVGNVVESDPQAVWMVEGAGFPINNAPILKGARTINTTQVYPDLSRWRTIDSEDIYEDVYNRYAHIVMIYGENEEKFVLLNKDYFLVYVNYEDLINLNVDYIFSNRDLSAETRFEFVDTAGGYYLYRVLKE